MRPRACQRVFEGFATLRLCLALPDLFLQFDRKLQLRADHAHQNQYKGAQHHRHQVAEDGPGRRSRLQLGFDLVRHHDASPAGVRCASSKRSSSTICFCDIMLSSMTSLACAT